MVSVEKVPIQWDVQGGKGVIKVGNAGYAELEPYKSASGATTTLGRHGVLDGSRRAGVRGEGPRYTLQGRKLGIDLDLSGHNALQSTFVFDA